jgi:hypothetical protein
VVEQTYRNHVQATSSVTDQFSINRTGKQITLQIKRIGVLVDIGLKRIRRSPSVPIGLLAELGSFKICTKPANSNIIDDRLKSAKHSIQAPKKVLRHV